MLMLVLMQTGLQLPSIISAYSDAASACASVALSPSSSVAWEELGQILHGKGRLEASRIALERAAGLDSQSASARIRLANVLRSTGRFDDAIAALREAADITGARDQSLCYYRAPTETMQSFDDASLGAVAVRGGPAPECADDSDMAWVSQIASEDECEWVIQTAEAFNEARGGWGNPPPRYAPAGTVADNVRAPHMLVADSPELLAWLNSKLEADVWPLLAKQFGRAAADDAWLYDAFLLRFDGAPGRRGLGVHVDDDGLGLSINLLLSPPDAFEGGGTKFFTDRGGEFTITPRRGELVSHHGGLRHASVPTTAGTRYILVAFLRSPSLLASPPEYIEAEGSYCAASQAAAARWLASDEARDRVDAVRGRVAPTGQTGAAP